MVAFKPLHLDALYGYPTEFSSTDTMVAGLLSTLGIGGVGLNLNGNAIQNLADPVNATDAANKRYVDGLAQGITYMPSVTVLANSNVTLSGLQTIDGVSLGAGARVLCAGQTNAVQNGIWVVASGTWTRPTAADDYTTGRTMAGLLTYIESGTNFAAEQWAVVGANTGKVDTDASSWSQMTGAAEIIAGNGLQKSSTNGNTLSVIVATNSGLQFTSGALDTQLNPGGSLAKGSTGLGVTVNANNTLATDASGLRVLGLPSLFTVAGTATAGTVSASALNTLTAGSSSMADALHQHTNVLQSQAVVQPGVTNGSTALTLGQPVIWSSTNNVVAAADASAVSSSQCIGVAMTAIAANGTGPIIKRGILQGAVSGGTAGAPIYIAVGGGLSLSVPSAAGASVVRVGTCLNSNGDADIQPQFIGTKSSS